MKFFLDTEFIESGHTNPIFLLSIGLVSEDNRTYYAESSETDLTLGSPWVQANVIPHLKGGTFRKTREEIAKEILDFVGRDQPEFWAYFADYDWVVLCQLYGSMVELPKNFPHICLDLKQRMMALNVPRRNLPAQSTIAHNALNDAEWGKAASEYLDTVEAVRNAQRT